MSIRNHMNHQPEIGEYTYVDEQATIIGKVKLGKNVSVWPQVVLRGDDNYIEIGDNSNIQDGTVVHVLSRNYTPKSPKGLPTILGENVTVGHGCILHACQIGSNCLIGMGAIILDGSIIENDVFVAAGALVSPYKKLESGYLYVGNPAIKKRKLTQEEINFFTFSAQHYVKVKNQYLQK